MVNNISFVQVSEFLSCHFLGNIHILQMRFFWWGLINNPTMYAFAAYRRTLKIDCPLLSSWLVRSVTFLNFYKIQFSIYILQTLINFVVFCRAIRLSRNLKTMTSILVFCLEAWILRPAWVVREKNGKYKTTSRFVYYGWFLEHTRRHRLRNFVWLKNNVLTFLSLYL